MDTQNPPSTTNGSPHANGGFTIRSTGEITNYINEHLGEKKYTYTSGIDALDQALYGGFRDGLYIIGGVTSTGKTDIVMQISDHIARQGHSILYFSLEMSDVELVSRSLSRYMAQAAGSSGLKNAISDTDIIYNYGSFDLKQIYLLADVMDKYARYTDGRLFIVSGMMDITVEMLRSVVVQHIKKTGCTPVVIVDYMQIVAPSNPRGDTRQNIDHVVKALKQLSRDFGATVIAISSFNRANYRAEADFTALKESGCLEYSADAVIALQFSRIRDEDYDFDAEISKVPREVEAKVLKLRKGRPGGRVNLDYYSACHTFLAAQQPPTIQAPASGQDGWT